MQSSYGMHGLYVHNCFYFHFNAYKRPRIKKSQRNQSLFVEAGRMYALHMLFNVIFCSGHPKSGVAQPIPLNPLTCRPALFFRWLVYSKPYFFWFAVRCSITVLSFIGTYAFSLHQSRYTAIKSLSGRKRRSNAGCQWFGEGS